MNFYIDIKLLPDAEISAPVLMNAIYVKLHKTLFNVKATNIGVSFPKKRTTLGHILRLHGSDSALRDLHDLNWLGGMTGYCNVSQIQTVPATAQHRVVSRKQSTMSQAKLKRLLKRGSITEEEAKNYRAKMFTKGLNNPYVELLSGSNGHRHRRYIEFGPLKDSPTDGQFDQFGLSKTATIPWF